MRALLTASLLVLGLLLAAGALGSPRARQAAAAELVENRSFEIWDAGEPLGWSASGNVTAVSTPSVSGSAARIDGAGSLSQYVAATPGTVYTGSVQAVAATGSSQLSLRLTFLNSGLQEVVLPVETTILAPSSFTSIQVVATAPAGAAYVGMRLAVSPLGAGAAAVFDDASLDDAPQPSPTPTFTPTATNTATPTPTSTGTQTPMPGATPVRPGIRTSTPPRGTVSKPGVAIPGPTGREPGEELLQNPGFEFIVDGLPLMWAKFGGILSASPSGIDGSGAAVLISQTDSTKWVHQLVAVEAGAWYRGGAMGRVTAGSAELSVSILWYPTFDGDGPSVDGTESLRSPSTTWVQLDTGPVQAPPGVRSARFRIMLRSPFPAAAVFDDASFVQVSVPEDSMPMPSATPAAEMAGTPTPMATAMETGTPGVSASPRPVIPLPPRTGSGLWPALNCSICLSEIMPDPPESGRDGPYEWIEVYNNGSDVVDLGGWYVGDATAMDAIPGPALLDPGGFLVIRGRSADVGDVPAVIVPDGEIGTGLANDGDVVMLLNPDGEVVDSIAYGADLGGFPAPGAGRSLSRDITTGEWYSKARPSPGMAMATDTPTGSEPGQSLLDRDLAMRPEPAPQRTPWIILGICVTIGVFSAPFAIERLRRELRATRGG